MIDFPVRYTPNFGSAAEADSSNPHFQAWIQRLSEQLDLAKLAPQTEAARDVLAERQRQIEAEGWTPEHDDEHDDGALAMAAASYAVVSAFTPMARAISAEAHHHSETLRELWPWADDWWKPTTRRRDLVKAGALILAEIERLDRADARGHGDG